MIQHFLLIASGKDRPGIVAAVTQILFEDGCNIEEAKMTRLGSEFAMLALVAGPKGLSPKSVEAALRKLRKRLGILAEFRPLTAQEAAAARPKGTRWHLMVRGKDRPGIVYQVSTLLTSMGVNIADAATKLDFNAGASPIVNLFLDIELPARLSSTEFKAKLDDRSQTLGLSFQIQRAAPPA
jgi:glycine cleavage system transcriptional repressor